VSTHFFFYKLGNNTPNTLNG